MFQAFHWKKNNNTVTGVTILLKKVLFQIYMVVSMTVLSCFLLKSLKYLIKDGYFSLNLSFAKVKVVRKEEESISPKVGQSEARRNVLEKLARQIQKNLKNIIWYICYE